MGRCQTQNVVLLDNNLLVPQAFDETQVEGHCHTIFQEG
jgi:hypothetical protein